MPRLRLVSWNCNQGIGRKGAPLVALRPDVAVVQEVGSGALLGDLSQVGWTGRASRKGLAVFARPELDAAVDASWDPAREWFLPVRLAAIEVTVLGVWAMNQRGKEAGPRLGRTLRALEGYARLLATGRAIVVGDFNDNGRWDDDGRPSFRETRAFLADMGYVSIYHARTNEPHGAESRGSLYWYRHRDRPYLVDHCFLPERWLGRVADFRLGEPEDWLRTSDHVPLILDFDVP